MDPPSATAALRATTAGLAIVTGITAVGARPQAARLPRELICEPAIQVFVVGLALTTIAGQLPKLSAWIRATAICEAERR